MSDDRALTVDGWGAPRSKTVSWYDPAISASAGASIPGREHLQAIIDGKLPVPPFAALVGARLDSVAEGEAVFRCTPDESTYNPAGVVHGGLLCMLLDSACGCAVQSLLPAGVAISSIEIKVSFLSPLRSDSGELEIRGRRSASAGRWPSPRPMPAAARASSSGTRPRRSRCCGRRATDR